MPRPIQRPGQFFSGWLVPVGRIAEIELAHEIHQLLVPRIDARIGRFEFCGASLPSGEVGGDLVDLVMVGDARWIGYIADVSGHGHAVAATAADLRTLMRQFVNRLNQTEFVSLLNKQFAATQITITASAQAAAYDPVAVRTAVLADTRPKPGFLEIVTGAR